MASTGERLRELRERLGLSQTQVAEAAGLSQSTIVRLEADTASAQKLRVREALSRAFMVSLDSIEAFLEGTVSVTELREESRKANVNALLRAASAREERESAAAKPAAADGRGADKFRPPPGYAALVGRLIAHGVDEGLAANISIDLSEVATTHEDAKRARTAELRAAVWARSLRRLQLEPATAAEPVSLGSLLVAVTDDLVALAWRGETELQEAIDNANDALKQADAAEALEDALSPIEQLQRACAAIVNINPSRRRR